MGAPKIQSSKQDKARTIKSSAAYVKYVSDDFIGATQYCDEIWIFGAPMKKAGG
jgi:hypothetical protein